MFHSAMVNATKHPPALNWQTFNYLVGAYFIESGSNMAELLERNFLQGLQAHAYNWEKGD